MASPAVNLSLFVVLVLVVVAATNGADVDYVTVEGVRFAVIDNTDPTEVQAPCVADLYELPAGWSVATNTSEALLAINLFRFGTFAVVMADGAAYTTGAAPAPFATGNSLRTDGSRFGVDFCSKRVLISQPADVSDVDSVRPAMTITNMFEFDGIEYATLDNSPVAQVGDGCGDLRGYYEMPAGWAVAAADENTRTAVIGRSFGTVCLAVDGTSYVARSGSTCSKADSLRIVVHPATPLLYGITYCNNRVLISRPAAGATVPTTMMPAPSNTYYTSGRLFATLDASPLLDVFDSSCQTTPLMLPAGWTIATNDTEGVMEAITMANWGTWCLTMAHGSGFVASSGIACGDQSQLVMHKTNDGREFYGVSTCNKRILITTSFTDAYTLPMRFLVLTSSVVTEDRPTFAVAESVLDGFGSQYDVYDTSVDASLELYDAQGQPKYMGVIVTSDNVMAGPETNITLSMNERASLDSYLLRFRARLVCLYSVPNKAGLVSNSARFSPNANYGVAIDAAIDPILLNGLVADAAFARDAKSGFARVAVVDVNDTRALTDVIPVLRYVASAADKAVDADPIAAAILAVRDGADVRTQQMHFFFDMSVSSMEGPALGNMWLPWLSHNVYLGQRRMLLSTQVDDYFLSTNLFDDVAGVPRDWANCGTNCVAYRLSGDDLRFAMDWQANMTRMMPAGSDFTLEMSLNGVGAMDANARGSDILAVTQQLKDNFRWHSHTWSHLDLTCPEADCDANNATTYGEAFVDLFKNDFFVDTYFWDDDAPERKISYSQKSAITPRISGLFNPEALRALWDNGIRYIVGDTSRSETVASTSPYHAMWTTFGKNGWDGILVVPRHPTRMYFDSSSVAEETAEHDYYYGQQGLTPVFDHKLTIDEILDLESKFAANMLMRFRHDPYMFHQANLRSDQTYKNKRASLLSMWTESVLEEMMRYVKMPLLSLKQDDLAELYVERMERDACGIDARVAFTAGVANSLDIATDSDCTVVVTGATVSGIHQDFNYTMDIYGADMTLRMPAQADSAVTVPLTNAIVQSAPEYCADDEHCFNGNMCMVGTCQGSGLGCVYAQAPPCDDNDPCTVDSCDPAVGCVHVALPECCVNDASCDNKPCHKAICRPGSGPTGVCRYLVDDASLVGCDDGDMCNGVDSCSAGVCSTAPAPVCKDDNMCTTEECVSGVGCVFTPANPCDDGNPCTDNVCDAAANQCSYPTTVCDDKNVCTTDSCDELGVGCVYTPTVTCSDNDECTLDRCDAVLGCVFEPMDDCYTCATDADCPARGCNKPTCGATGLCSYAIDDSEIELCDDHDGCTVDSCADGACLYTEVAECRCSGAVDVSDECCMELPAGPTDGPVVLNLGNPLVVNADWDIAATPAGPDADDAVNSEIDPLTCVGSGARAVVDGTWLALPEGTVVLANGEITIDTKDTAILAKISGAVIRIDVECGSAAGGCLTFQAWEQCPDAMPVCYEPPVGVVDVTTVGGPMSGLAIAAFSVAGVAAAAILFAAGHTVVKRQAAGKAKPAAPAADVEAGAPPAYEEKPALPPAAAAASS